MIISWVIVQSKQLHESTSSLRDYQTRSKLRSSDALRDLGKIQDITDQLLALIHRNISPKVNAVWFFCFPSHNQNERNVRDMATYDIKAVILDSHVESSLPKCLAKEMDLAIPRPT